MRYAIPLMASLFFSAGIGLAADGAALFKQNCASCHGATGQADTPASKALKVPALAGDAKVAGMSDADVAGERGHVQGLAGWRVGVARRAVTARAVLLEEGPAVSGDGGAGGGEEESCRERNRVAHRGLLSRQLILGRLLLRKAPARQCCSR